MCSRQVKLFLCRSLNERSITFHSMFVYICIKLRGLATDEMSLLYGTSVCVCVCLRVCCALAFAPSSPLDPRCCSPVAQQRTKEKKRKGMTN